jgi:hypothetical protein
LVAVLEHPDDVANPNTNVQAATQSRRGPRSTVKFITPTIQQA